MPVLYPGDCGNVKGVAMYIFVPKTESGKTYYDIKIYKYILLYVFISSFKLLNILPFNEKHLIKLTGSHTSVEHEE